MYSGLHLSDGNLKFLPKLLRVELTGTILTTGKRGVILSALVDVGSGGFGPGLMCSANSNNHWTTRCSFDGSLVILLRWELLIRAAFYHYTGTSTSSTLTRRSWIRTSVMHWNAYTVTYHIYWRSLLRQTLVRSGSVKTVYGRVGGNLVHGTQ